MNFGDCPYCYDFIGFFEVPERTPAYSIVKCESCGKDIWYRFSRIDPQSWTIEDFEKEFIIDTENKKIVERNPEPEIELQDDEIQIMRAMICKMVDDFIINGDPTAIEKPTGILSAREYRKRTNAKKT